MADCWYGILCTLLWQLGPSRCGHIKAIFSVYSFIWRWYCISIIRLSVDWLTILICGHFFSRRPSLDPWIHPWSKACLAHEEPWFKEEWPNLGRICNDFESRLELGLDVGLGQTLADKNEAVGADILRTNGTCVPLTTARHFVRFQAVNHNSKVSFGAPVLITYGCIVQSDLCSFVNINHWRRLVSVQRKGPQN